MRSVTEHPRSGSYASLFRLLCFGTVIWAVNALAAYAQNPKLELGPLQKLAAKAQEVTDVTVDGAVLNLAQRFMANDQSAGDAEARKVIEELKGIYIRRFKFDKEGEYSREDVDQILDQLHRRDWRNIVAYRKEKESESENIYVMGSGDAIKGLAIVSAKPKELTVVNIVGSIDLKKLSDLEGHFGIPRVELHSSGSGKEQ
jgi:hypothetical protein